MPKSNIKSVKVDKRAGVSETPVPVETKEQKLIRLSTARVGKACKAISLIGNLAAYKPTDDDVDKIMEALGGQASSVEARLRGVKKEIQPFSLRNHPPSQG